MRELDARTDPIWRIQPVVSGIAIDLKDIPASRRNAIATRYHRLEAFDAWKAAAA